MLDTLEIALRRQQPADSVASTIPLLPERAEIVGRLTCQIQHLPAKAGSRPRRVVRWTPTTVGWEGCGPGRRVTAREVAGSVPRVAICPALLRTAGPARYAQAWL